MVVSLLITKQAIMKQHVCCYSHFFDTATASYNIHTGVNSPDFYKDAE